MWTQLQEVRVELDRLWLRGGFARLLVQPDEISSLFPLRLALKAPNTVAITEQFSAVRAWADHWSQSRAPIRIEWRDVQHRVQGRQRLPAQLWVDRLEDVLVLISKQQDARRLQQLTELTRASCPELLAWLVKNALKALALIDVWPLLLQVVQWCQRHPCPGIYLRQMDIAGIDSKFIEQHRAVLAELLDQALPPSAINHHHKGQSQFTARYGFLDKPLRIRFRLLDQPLVRLSDETIRADITLDSHSFAHLQLPIRRVFITENEINFLAFPKVTDALVIFGAGYGWQALASAKWLHHCAIYYWGDIDTHGFAILDQLRALFPHVRSLLMDHATLQQHLSYCGQEPKPIHHDLPRLTTQEQALFNDLRDNRMGKHLRLEQERVGFLWLNAALARIADAQVK